MNTGLKLQNAFSLHFCVIHATNAWFNAITFAFMSVVCVPGVVLADGAGTTGLLVVVVTGNETVFFSSSVLLEESDFGAAGAKLNIFFIVSSLFSFGVPNVALLLSTVTFAPGGMPKENIFFSGSDGFLVGDDGAAPNPTASLLLGCIDPNENVVVFGVLCAPEEATEPNENPVAFLSGASSAFALGGNDPNEKVPFGVADVSFAPAAGEPNVTVGLSGVSAAVAGLAAGEPNEKIPLAGTAAADSFDAAGELPNVNPFLSVSAESVLVAGEPNANVLFAAAGELPKPNGFFSASFVSDLVAFEPKLNIPVEEAALREESFEPIGDPKAIVFFSVSPASVLAAAMEPNEKVAFGVVSAALSLLPPANPNVKLFSGFEPESVVFGTVPKEKFGVDPALTGLAVAVEPPKLNNPLLAPSLSLSFEDDIPNPDDVEDAFFAPSVLSAFSAFGVPKVNIFLLASAAAPIVP